MGMEFSCCAQMRDKVVTHVGPRCVAVWRHRAEARGMVATLSEGRWHGLPKPTDTIALGRAQFSCTIIFPIKQNRSKFEIQNECLSEFKTC
jgi:hypothetical protein